MHPAARVPLTIPTDSVDCPRHAQPDSDHVTAVSSWNLGVDKISVLRYLYCVRHFWYRLPTHDNITKARKYFARGFQTGSSLMPMLHLLAEIFRSAILLGRAILSSGQRGSASDASRNTLCKPLISKAFPGRRRAPACSPGQSENSHCNGQSEMRGSAPEATGLPSPCPIMVQILVGSGGTALDRRRSFPAPQYPSTRSISAAKSSTCGRISFSTCG
jgi:hypothetical protein